MDHTLKVTIPYEAGLSDTEMLLKVTRAVTDAASKKGLEGRWLYSRQRFFGCA